MEIEQIIAELNEQVVAEIGGKPVKRGELLAVFNKVVNKKNWKREISCEVALSPEELALMSPAVEFFAGCAAEVFPMGEGRYRVMAVGYYEAVGA